MPKKKKELEYNIGQWRGHPHYQCKSCPFDTLSQDEIEGHVALHRPVRKRAAQPVDSTLKPERAGGADEVFELELEEVSSFSDEDGNEHKQFTVKE